MHFRKLRTVVSDLRGGSSARACGLAIWRCPRERCCVVWICSLAPGTSANVLIRDQEGLEQAKGHFKDCALGANCIVLLIVPCFLGRRGVYTLPPPPLLSIPGGGGVTC